MNIAKKLKIALDLIYRGEQSIKFVYDYLKFMDKSMDEPRLRSFYILLSYGFEMILKSRIIMLFTEDENKLNKKLKNIGHDFVEISKILGKNELKNIEIIKIESKIEKCNTRKNSNDKRKYFMIKTITNKNIIIEDFTDVRYGCDRIEKTEKILEYIETIFEVSDKIKKINKK